MSEIIVLSSWLRKEDQQEERFLISEDEDDEKQIVEISESEKILKQMTNQQQIQLDVLHKAKFTTTFTGNPKDTIPYLFAVDMFFKVHMINNPKVRFSTIFQTLPIKYRENFMIENCEKDDYTIHDLFDWIINTFKPPRSKYEFELKLKSIKMRKAENPLTVYKRLQTTFSNIKKAIKLINKTITNEKQKLLPFTDEFKASILAGIFIRKNNNPNYDNVHELNKLVQKHCLRWSSHTMEDWDEIVNSFDRIIRDVLSGDKKYQYILYPPSKTENNIYFFRNNANRSHITKEKRFNKRRKHFNGNYNQKQNNKRQRISCQRCGKTGHIKKDCRSIRHANGQKLQRNNQIICHRCHRPGHKKDSCYSRNDKDGRPIPGKPPAKPPVHYKSGDNKENKLIHFKNMIHQKILKILDSEKN